MNNPGPQTQNLDRSVGTSPSSVRHECDPTCFTEAHWERVRGEEFFAATQTRIFDIERAYRAVARCTCDDPSIIPCYVHPNWGVPPNAYRGHLSEYDSNYFRSIAASRIIAPGSICSLYDCGTVHPAIDHAEYVREHG